MNFSPKDEEDARVVMRRVAEMAAVIKKIQDAQECDDQMTMDFLGDMMSHAIDDMDEDALKCHYAAALGVIASMADMAADGAASKAVAEAEKFLREAADGA